MIYRYSARLGESPTIRDLLDMSRGLQDFPPARPLLRTSMVEVLQILMAQPIRT